MFLFLFALLWLPLAHADNRPAPEAATGWQPQPLVQADQAMVVTANPHASRAAQTMLARGGSAVDAMIAAQMVLTLVEPQSSGLGGGGFLVHWHQEEQHLTTLDGRETAPQQAPPGLFLNDQGQPMGFMEAVVGGRSVGTPGTPLLMWQAHQRFGVLPWRELFAPAIDLALHGFAVSPRLARLIAQNRDSLFKDPDSRRYFFDPQGQPLAAGSRLSNPPLAALLTRLSIEGPSAFYSGKIAQLMVDKVQSAAGYLSLSDLEQYRVQQRPGLCFPYRRYKICGMGPPSSGTLALGQIMGMLSHFELSKLGPASPEAWRLMADASRLAFADRNRYAGDSDFVPVPVDGLLDPDYLSERAQLLKNTQRALPSVAPGTPNGQRPAAPDTSPEFPSTTHISIIDARGNAVSLTSTIENAFGSRLMVQGFLLNNELTDFAFVPEVDGVPVANRLQPGKRPRSSMSPTLVFDDQDRLLLVLGSPGGSSIIGYVLHALVNLLDWGMDVREAIHQPHVLHRGGALEMEPFGRNLALAPAMAALGFEVRTTELNSGLHLIMRTAGGLSGAADPRREGLALAAD
ncbi:gamma-glutamyltranspeptidase [Oceanimonas sp. GK1]|uniref:gamma-glutamyltransferase n=1 Tax=Oceanimonas sp. (strain GK1 / IBRC-M 10197) TaxID=511062 RepID=UPI0002495458|nr:gamma-glutamyltransferase [Oceanimonas sp. GK1]AEY01975.1 gamma-glutamyltranspeptidase [Oceanimonas sp. GK1]